MRQTMPRRYHLVEKLRQALSPRADENFSGVKGTLRPQQYVTVAPMNEPDEIDDMIDDILSSDPSLQRFARGANAHPDADASKR
jgi:hypothetical protein